MTDAQTWTLIGGFIAITATMNSLMLRIVRTEIHGMGYRFDSINSQFDTVNTRFDGLEARIDGLDRDVAMLVQRAIDD